jgi:hypothetical protein
MFGREPEKPTFSLQPKTEDIDAAPMNPKDP